MAQVFLHRDEAEDGDLPPVCVSCGRRAERWEPQRFSWHPWWVNNPLWLLFMKKRMNATLPYCAVHPRFLQGPVAAHIAHDGITLRRVDAEFVASVEAYRQRPRRRREAADSYHREPIEPRPRRERHERPRRERNEQPRRQAGSSAGCVLGILAIVGAGFVLLVGGGVLVFALLLPALQFQRARAPAPFFPPIAPPVVRADVPRLRQVAALVVGHGAGPAAENAVLPYVKHADARVRVEACQLLAVIGTAASTPALANAAADPNRAVAEAAAQALTAVEARQK